MLALGQSVITPKPYLDLQGLRDLLGPLCASLVLPGPPRSSLDLPRLPWTFLDVPRDAKTRKPRVRHSYD